MSFLYRLSHYVCSAFFRVFYRHRVVGGDNLPKGPALIAANHTSYLDPPLIGASTSEELHFLAREGLFTFRPFGWLIRSLNAHPIGSAGNDYRTLKTIHALLREGKKVVIFPEGERTLDGELNPIQQGTSRIALRAKVPIVPVYLGGAFAIWPRLRLFPRLFGRTICCFGKPIDCNAFSHLGKKEAQAAINNALDTAWREMAKQCKEEDFQKKG